MPTASSAKAVGRSGTIRSQLLLAFLAMSIITSSLGFFSVRDLEREGGLVDRTFDQSLMSISFARAAAADFNALQAAAARRALAKDDATRATIDKSIAELEATMDDDLSVAVERAQSDRAIAAAQKVAKAVVKWKAARLAMTPGANAEKAWAALDHQAGVVGQQIDLLVNYMAGDAFTYRQMAHATVLSDKRFNIIATLLALMISGAIAWLISRRVVLPIKKASEIAGRIADGELDVTVPVGNADELGALFAAMETMRGNIKASMEREVALRESAQMRLADALEGSCEGIVVVAADERIALANAQASRLLDGICAPFRPGDPAVRLLSRIALTQTDADRDVAWEVELAEGRWLRVSRSATQEDGSVFVYSDISLFKAQQAAIKTANLWLDSALGNLSQGLCLFDSSNELRVYNQRFCEIFKLPAERLHQGMTLDALLDLGFKHALNGQSREETRMHLQMRIEARAPFQKLLALNDGRSLAVSHRPLPDNSWLATYEDVTDRLQAAEKIAYMARHDALTGLPNRTFFAERIETALMAAARGERFALMCLDLDHFKEVNDTLGHPIGDELLRTVADRLSAAVRETDTVARLGGDEFAIIQTGVESAHDVSILAQRVIDSLNGPCEIEGNPVLVGVSIGISMAPHDGRSYDKLLKNADMALYRAKADGRNGFCFFERAMDERQQSRRLVELDLREALACGQFEVDYQPVCDVAEDRITSFEALLRWRHPVRGLVPPSDFIPIAEEMGLIPQIGEWVLHRACRDAVDWPADISVAINVSAAQLRHAGLADQVVLALERSGLAASRLVLEITETVLIANAQHALLVLNRLKSMGIRIAMDDFGTGYSSLSYLRAFPFDHVKIDKSFISEMTTRPEAAAIVRAVIALCASLGMRTIAEGIETEEQLAFLKVEGCHEAQGYFFSRPIEVGAVPALIETQVSLTDFFAVEAA